MNYKNIYKLLGVISLLIIFRSPYYTLLIDIAGRQHTTPWANDFALWGHWDTALYNALSSNYTINDCYFFPLYPLVLQLLRKIFPWATPSAINIPTSNFFTFLALGIIWLLACKLYPPPHTHTHTEDTHKKNRWFNSVIGLTFACAVFPSSHFWSNGYSEAFFMCLYAMTLLLVTQKKWMPAAFFSSLLSVTRPQGPWIMSAFLAVYFFQRKTFLFKIKKPLRFYLNDTAVFIVCVTPLFIFLLWQWNETGNPLYFLTLQHKGWGRSFNLFQALKDHLPWILNISHLSLAYFQDYLFLVFSWVAFFRFIRRPEAHWQLLALSTLMIGEVPIFFGGYYSYFRFMSINIGLLVLLVELAENRPWLGIGYIVWALTRLATSVMCWTGGGWCG